MAWEESSRICLNMQLIAILSRIGVIYKNTEIYFSMFFPYFYLLMFYQCGTVFQTAFLTTCYNPETSSRVTLAALGIGFQPNLMVIGHL